MSVSPVWGILLVFAMHLQRLWICSLWLLTAWPALATSLPVLSVDRAEVRRAPDAAWHAVALPHSWSREQPPWEGVARYRLHFDLPATGDSAQPWAIYLPRAGNRYALWLNGQAVASTGELVRTEEDHVHQAHYFVLPQGTLSPRNNQLLLELHGERARYAGLGKVWLGPAAVIRQMYQERAAWHQGGALVMVGLATVMGVIGVGFGMVMGARVYGLFGSAALLWAIRNTYVLTSQPPIGHPFWNILLDVLYALSVLLLCSSVLMILRVSSRAWRVSQPMLLLGTALLPLAFGWTGVWLWRQAFLLSLVLGVVVCVALVLRRWRAHPSTETHVLGLAALLSLGFALYDHVAIMWLSEGYTHFALSRFSFLFILLAMSVLLMRRVLRSLNTARRFRQRLQARLDRARLQLSALHEERERVHVRDAELAERMRILSQMHDGVGAHLVAMHQLLNQTQVPTQALQDEVTQAGLALRDSLSALQNTPERWTTALATLRDTLEARLHHAHIALVWDVQDEPPLAPPTAAAYQHLRLWLTEVMTNVIKHSGASTVRLSTDSLTTTDGRSWQICVQDNGRGVPTTHPEGLGTRTLGYRAQWLGARTEIRNTTPGTCVTLTWRV